MQWFRMYNDITWDRKLRRHPTDIRWVWVGILCLANKSPQPGYLLLSRNVPVTFQDVSDETAVPLHVVENAIKIFIEQDMLEEENGIFHVVNWNKRQFISDDSTARVRKHREKKRSGNVSVTPQNTDTDTDTDTDINNNIPKKTEKSVLKKQYAEFVSMTEEEYKKLTDQYGELMTQKMIQALDNYKGANGKKYKSDYRAILNWVVDKVLNQNKQFPKSNSPPDPGRERAKKLLEG